MRTSYLRRRDLQGLRELEQGQPAAQRTDSAGSSRTAPPEPNRLAGNTRAMRTLRHTITRVAASDATVLVHGESGTGKELVAEAIHELSTRSGRPIGEGQLRSVG